MGLVYLPHIGWCWMVIGREIHWNRPWILWVKAPIWQPTSGIYGIQNQTWSPQVYIAAQKRARRKTCVASPSSRPSSFWPWDPKWGLGDNAMDWESPKLKLWQAMGGRLGRLVMLNWPKFSAFWFDQKKGRLERPRPTSFHDWPEFGLANYPLGIDRHILR